ncbi:putative tetratricopeptide-like helical domain superfamily [Helianthus annuus]|nr:putative tetratricopeptide-like helical domain superfamily [Helianthus annuus]
MEENTLIDGNHTKIARSQGKKIQITVLQEYSWLLGNLAWAYLQQDYYKVAEETYRKALSLEPDKNKRCNLASCLMYMNKMAEANVLLSTVKESKRVTTALNTLSLAFSNGNQDYLEGSSRTLML